MQLPSSIQTPYNRVREWIAAAQEWVEETIFWRVWLRLLENEFVDRSVAIAAKAFVSLFPALIVVASFMPEHIRASILSSMTRRMGVSGQGLTTVKAAFATSNSVRQTTGILGLLFTFFYINSFISALQRVYVRAWRRPPAGRVSAYALGAGWLMGVVVYFALIGGARAFFGNGPQTLGFLILAWIGTMLLWTLTAWTMLVRNVRFRALLPTGMLTGTGMLVYAATASLWMPNTVATNQRQFGFFGVALALVTWLTGAGMILVVSASAGSELAADEGVLGRLTRGGANASALRAGAPESLPPPINAPGLASAIGVRRHRADAPVDAESP